MFFLVATLVLLGGKRIGGDSVYRKLATKNHYNVVSMNLHSPSKSNTK